MTHLKTIFLLPLLLGSCEASMLLAQTDHLEVNASGITTNSAGGFHISQLKLTTPASGKLKFTEIELTVYKDRDGEAGFTSPPDTLVTHRKAESPEPTSNLSMDSITTNSPTNGLGDSFELTARDENGQDHTFSGSY